MILRFGPPSKASCVSYMLFSALFYGANMSFLSIYSTLRANFALPSHPLLSLEMTQVFQTIAMAFGLFLGPVLARQMLHTCLHQSVFVAFAFGIFAAQTVLGELGFWALQPSMPLRSIAAESAEN